MNILFLCSANAWGGNEKWTLAAAQGLAERGHHVRLGVRSAIFEERGAKAPLEIVRYPFAGKYDLKTVRQIRRDLREWDIDVLIPTKQREYFLSGLAAIRMPKVKIVARLGIDRPIRGWRNRLAFHRFFDRVIVNSRSIVDVLAQSPGFDPGICRVVYNGVPLPVLDTSHRPRIRAELGMGEEEFVIVGVGRLTAQKGFDRALSALAVLAKEVDSARLLLVGEGSDRATLEAQAASLGLSGRVVFAGFREDVPAVLQAADVFWLTSRSEGLPNVLLEAMAAQTACIAFDVAGVRELMPDDRCGLVVPDGDVEALAAATIGLARNEAIRKSLAEHVRARALADFSPETMVEATERVLLEACGQAK